MPPDEQRDRETREIAYSAFGRLLKATGPHWSRLVLIGGLVPETLVDADEPHQGTIDVDVLLPLALQFDREEQHYGWLEEALDDAAFVPAQENAGWRWVANVDGNTAIIEFLVDVPDSIGQEVVLPGTTRVGAMNLAGPGPALRDARTIRLNGQEARVAGIGGYLVAKAAAIVDRGLPKDLYDFAYVVVNSVRSSDDQAARAVAAAAAPSHAWDRDLRREVSSACRLFLSRDTRGAAAYASESRRSGSELSEEELAADAVAAVRLFRRRFEDIVASAPPPGA